MAGFKAVQSCSRRPAPNGNALEMGRAEARCHSRVRARAERDLPAWQFGIRWQLEQL